MAPMAGSLSVNSFEQIGLRAVEFLEPFLVFVGEIGKQFDVRTMHACPGADLSVAAAEDTF